MKTSKIIIIKLFAIFFIFGCNTKHKKETPITDDLNTTQTSEKLNCDNFNFSKIQKNYSLYSSRILSKNTKEFEVIKFFNKEINYPNHAFLLVINKKKDTLLKYFGHSQTISNSYVFLKNNDYFIQFRRSKSSYPKRLDSDRFYQIDTIKQQIVEIEKLDEIIFAQFFKSRIYDSIIKYYPIKYKRSSLNDFQLSTQSLSRDTVYSVECRLEFIKNKSNNFQLVARPERLDKKAIVKIPSNYSFNNSFGKINGYDLIYDCDGCRTASTDRITVYAKKDTIKTKLFMYNKFGGNYLGEISLRYFDNHPFIYIHSSHTYGHSLGDLYALDIENLKTNYVNKIEHNYKVPDSLYPRNFYGVDINKKGELTFGTWYRSDNVSGEYSLGGKYELIKVKENIYLLEPTDIKFWK